LDGQGEMAKCDYGTGSKRKVKIPLIYTSGLREFSPTYILLICQEERLPYYITEGYKEISVYSHNSHSAEICSDTKYGGYVLKAKVKSV
jgi:hypothetical protein